MNKFFSSRRFKHGSLATVIIIGFLVLVVVINVIATLLLERFPLTIDLTADNRFELTQESVDYIEDLQKEVKITVCVDEIYMNSSGEFYKQAYEIMKKYPKYSKNISLEFVDLQSTPAMAKKYPSENLAIGDILVESTDRLKKVSVNDLFSAEQSEYGSVVYSSSAEQALTGAIVNVVSETRTKVSLLTGLNNVDVTNYVNLLEQNNYEVTTQDIQLEEINPEAELVILAAPAVDLNQAQVKKLNDFLDNDSKFGKQLIYIASVKNHPGPVLASFLAEWGMEIGTSAIAETNSRNIVYNNNYIMLNGITDSSFTKKLKTTQLPLVGAFMSPINTLFETKDNRETHVLAQTSSTTVLVPLDDENPDLSKVEQGANNTIVKGMRKKYVGSELTYSSVTAVASDVFFDQEFLLNAGFNNGDVFVSLANDLTQAEDTVKIVPVKFVDEVITITEQQATTYNAVFVYVIPGIILLLGAVVWLRRRHL